MHTTFPFARFEIRGESMLPTYQPGDRVLVFRWRAVRPGDTVVFCRNGLTLVKRAVSKNSADRWTVRGDNFAKSTDSLEFGEVSESEIMGKVIAKY